MNHIERSTRIPSRRAGLLAVLRAFLGGPGRGVSSTSLAASSRRPIGVVALVFVPLLSTLFLAFGAPGACAETGPPKVEHFGYGQVTDEEFAVFPTRLSAEARVETTSNGEISWRFEYATGPSGPWTVAQRGTLNANAINASLSGLIARHLTPATKYYARVVAENEVGKSEETAEFTTLPVSGPAIRFPGQLGGEGDGHGEDQPSAIGCQMTTITAVCDTRVESNGAETEYSFEYALSETGPFHLFSSGATGKVSVAEDFAEPEAEIVGISPETPFYVRVKASNHCIAGEPARECTVTFLQLPAYHTRPAYPMVGGVGFEEDALSSVRVTGEVIPDESETNWRFEYTTEPGNPSSWSTPASGASGTIPIAEAGVEYVAVKGELTGLKPATTYYVRLFAENEHGEARNPGGEPVQYHIETAGPPSTTTFAVHALHGEAMRVLGDLRPHGYDTHYRFEYVNQEEFSKAGWADAKSTPEADAGGGGELEKLGEFSTEIVDQDLPILTPGETYRYRVVATSTAPGNPTVRGVEQALTVPTPAPAQEAPSCPNAALRSGPSAQLPDCRAFEQVTPSEKNGAMSMSKYGEGGLEGVQVGEDGDHFLVHAPGVKWGSDPDTVSDNYDFSRTSTGWQMTPFRPSVQAGPWSYRPLLLNSDLTQAALETSWATSFASQSADIEFEVGPPGGPYTHVASIPSKEAERSVDGWAGASADFSKAILQVEDHNLLGRSTGTISGTDIYEYANGGLRQVNVLGGSPGTPISTCGAKIAVGQAEIPVTEGEHALSSTHAVSADGSRVFFTDNCTHHLYMRVNGAETVDIGEYGFLAANVQGTELLLEHRSGEARELLLYDTESAAFKSLLTMHEEPHFLVSESSDELNTIYLSTTEQLAGTEAPPPTGQTIEVNDRSSIDVYRYDISSGTLRFLWQGAPPDEVSPDGRYAYGERGVGFPVSGQAYRYDSVENLVQCISCASSFNPEPKLGPARANFGVDESNSPTTRPISASANGEYAFFSDPAALVPQDVDGESRPEGKEGEDHGEHNSGSISLSSDIYEWRANGVDDCSNVQGCLSLITTGKGGFYNVLYGTTLSGDDVFFGTYESLVPQDTDSSPDVYDARIDGGFPPPAPRPTECEGDSCSTPFAPPNDLTPSSATFQGTGDIISAIPPVVSKAKPKPKKAKAKRMKPKRRKPGRPDRQARRSGEKRRAGR